MSQRNTREHQTPLSPPPTPARGGKQSGPSGRNDFEKSLCRTPDGYEKYRSLFVSDADLNALFKRLRLPESSWEEQRKQYDDSVNRRMAANGGKVSIQGKKPTPNDIYSDGFDMLPSLVSLS
ncbi:hypothetical protein CONPUDRAFT_169577 [Coniophora puteana RWD-64-598 SS2]|uniref:Uncharacterized protein n=1 Tax=Coniophora puteana (strain RWD-64-598) TaxID=741705 RepID=A0A5M3M8H3_CONPW|nr:uncharacterized protein CONPUDRAFT_169577 [Coniophora puteana RWD-64-598 SS2]EIW75174.1 hypothetical protein CONPUDRAFT_169577 [Coniophora puteana RWD-64-598 SS2]